MVIFFPCLYQFHVDGKSQAILWQLSCLTRLDVSESGLAALVRLSNGDMRKALNILQVIKICAHILSICVALAPSYRTGYFY